MTLSRKILTGFIACVLLIIGVAIFAVKSSEKVITSNSWVDHTNQVLAEFEQIKISTVTAESAMRGFVISGDNAYLSLLASANSDGTGHQNKVKELTKDNLLQQKNIAELESEYKRHVDFFNRCIDLNRKDPEKARQLVASGEGKSIEETIKTIIERAQESENTLLAGRKQINLEDAGNFNLVFGLLMLTIIITLIVVYKIIATNLAALKKAETEALGKNWLLAGSSELSAKLSGEKSLEDLANNIISFICTYLKANIGAVYLFDEKDKTLSLTGQFAFSSPQAIKQKFSLHEGLIGQAAFEKKQISLTDIDSDQVHITSSVLDIQPRHLLITPFLFEGKTVGIIEVGSLSLFTETDKEFIAASMDSIAISINTALNQQSLREVYKELEEQALEKEKRAAELAVANKELAFQNSEKESRASELVIANKELAFQSEEKESRAAELLIANKELAFQNKEKESRAAELVIANQELAFQNNEKENRAAELGIANKELAFQNQEKEKRASELILVNKELEYQTEELQSQQEELRQMNEELEEQTQNLKQQQEELQMTNEELEEQTQSLEFKNKEVETAKNDIEQKTKQLEISSKYKSEFLANMSHELRTPLNSLLILSKDLADNKKKNLDAVQVECAEIIYKSGHDLLVLINEVLDLSKIEAGKMSITIERVYLKSFMDDLLRDFKHHATQKGLKLISELSKGLPDSIRTDSQRLNQIMKNLLSNAIKFTAKGSVTLSVSRNTETTLLIKVADTGIGIQKEKQTAIFEAFQQADGGTSRKYGGTGLGLSISRELAKLLGAEIMVNSNLNEGSVFSVIVPLELHNETESHNAVAAIEPVAHSPRPADDSRFLNYPSVADDRNTVTKDDKIVLVIEDDLKFSAILVSQAKLKGFKCLAASTGEDGLALAAKYKPNAIVLDMVLPGINGHQVLHELKANPLVRHIPVHVISGNDRSIDTIHEGALEYLMKPIEKSDLEKAFGRIEKFVNRKIKNLLIIEDNENSRKSLKLLIGNGDVKYFEAGTGQEAIALYQKNHIDCIILDIGLPDISGFDLIRELGDIKGHAMPPIIVYTGRELTKEENDELQKYAKSIIIKGVKSEERLLDETALFLHRTISNLTESKQQMINSLYNKETVFHRKKILLADDDSRNIFALSKILEERGMEIIKAENGKIALDMLALHPVIDLVLMDIMMPEMDGYEAMKRIRSQIKFRNLPIIALTAKAMKDDKQKCIDAGANDYITKPIDVDRLMSLMRVWLSK